MIFNDLLKNILSGHEVELRYSFVTDADYQELFALVQHIMVSFDKSYLIEAVFMVLKEILVNSNRANAKRVFFERSNYQIEDVSQYEKGIQEFKQVVLENWKSFHHLLDQSSYYILLRIKIDDNKFSFEIVNNCEILPIEKQRIDSRIAASDQYSDIISAYKDIADYQESAGLGIVMMIIFLKSVGLSKNHLVIRSKNGVTSTKLTVPREIIPKDLSKSIQLKIAKKLKGIPSLPEHLLYVIDMCKSHTADFTRIAFEIEKNPAISSDLLKLANSTKYIVSEPVTSVKTALQFIGLVNTVNVLYGISSRKIMEEIFPQMQIEWEHATRVSHYATLLAHQIGNHDTETVAVAGLLHDIGKFVLLSIEGELLQEIWSLLQKRDAEHTQIIEEVVLGVSHSELGAILAEKWNFPKILVSMIRHHQRPHLVEPEFKECMEIVYMSNMIANYKDKKIDFPFIQKNIATKFGVTDEPSLEQLITKLDE
jgi:putative nucleotidyltransferase with HDIG domain